MITTNETMKLNHFAKSLAKVADETLTVKEIWEKAGKPCSLSNVYAIINKHSFPHKKLLVEFEIKFKDFVRDIEKYADETLTVKEIWEKAGKPGILSNAYYVVRKYKLPHKEETKIVEYNLIDQIKCIQTHDLTIREIMSLLGLSTHNDYCLIYQALVKNNLPFKRNTKNNDKKLNSETNLYGENKMKRGHREQTGYFRDLVKYADETLTVKEIWEKAGKPCSLSNAYYVVRKNDLAHKKDTNKKRPFKYLEQIKCFQTHNLTIREMMRLLGLSTHNDYYCIHQTLVKNNLPFKYSDDKRKDRGSKYDFKLLSLDTASMSIKEIAKNLGIIKTWEISKLYTALRNLGLTYRKEK